MTNKNRLILASTFLVVAMLAGLAQAGPVTVTVQGVTGSNGGNWPSWLGHLTDMCNGNLSYDFSDQGVTDHNPAMDISADPYDPASWLFVGNGNYQAEWSPNAAQLLDPATTLSNKILWAVFDFGSVIPVDKMYIWNRRNSAGTGDTAEYNVYYSIGVGIDALPAMPQSKTSRGDYDFSSGDWTLFNSGGPLTLAKNTANNNTFQTNIILGGISAQYVAIEILKRATDSPVNDNLGGSGLGQVEFTIDDTTPPTVSIADNDADDAIDVNNPITYTLTFSEDMRPETITAGMFSNADGSGPSINVDYITVIAADTYDVVVTPTSIGNGNLQLQVSSNVLDLGGNPMAANAIDVETITVGSDSATPVLLSITDGNSGRPSALGFPIRYTLTFSEYMNIASFAAGDFANISNDAFTVTAITADAVPSVIYVDVTPNATGYLQLRLNSGSVTDESGNPTTQDWDDDTTLAIVDPGTVSLIYEAFEDADATLSGNTPGEGLTGTWSASAAVAAGSIAFSELVTSGNKVTMNNTYGGVSVGTILYDKGLLNDGVNLWFSAVIKTGDDIATNGDLGFAFGTDRIGSGNNIPIINSGQALGVRFKNNQLRAAFWAPSLLVSTGDGVSPSTIYFVVGKFTWGSTNDTVEVYNVGTDLVLGSPSSTYTTSENVDQTQFDTVSFGSKAVTTVHHEIDEIRFGATFESVLKVPPPAGTIFMFK